MAAGWWPGLVAAAAATSSRSQHAPPPSQPLPPHRSPTHHGAVLAFFAWRGFKQWRLYKQKQAEEGGSESSPREHDEQAAGDDGKAGAGAQAAAAAPGKDAGEAAAAAAVAAAARGGAGDIELGLLPPVPGICSQPVPGRRVVAGGWRFGLWVGVHPSGGGACYACGASLSALTCLNATDSRPPSRAAGERGAGGIPTRARAAHRCAPAAPLVTPPCLLRGACCCRR